VSITANNPVCLRSRNLRLREYSILLFLRCYFQFRLLRHLIKNSRSIRGSIRLMKSYILCLSILNEYKICFKSSFYRNMLKLILYNLLIILIISCKDNSNKESKSNLKEETEVVDSNILKIRNYFSTCNYLLIAFPLNKPKSFIVADSLFKDSINKFYPFVGEQLKYDTSSCSMYKPYGTIIVKNNKDSTISSINFSLDCHVFIVQNRLGRNYYLIDNTFEKYLFEKYKSVESVINKFNYGIDY
jgi:hypothetical protein